MNCQNLMRPLRVSSLAEGRRAVGPWLSIYLLHLNAKPIASEEA